MLLKNMLEYFTVSLNYNFVRYKTKFSMKVIQVTYKQTVNEFHQLQHKIYKNNKNRKPRLLLMIKETFDPNKNAKFKIVNALIKSFGAKHKLPHITPRYLFDRKKSLQKRQL